MPPNQGLVHLKEYDVEDSNVELIGSDIDHKVKYASATTEPAWNDGKVGVSSGLFVWRIEQFEVVVWPKDKHGHFFDGDSYIVLLSREVGEGERRHLAHDVYFWLGAHTSQDEAGTAAYKTVELDEFLKGAAIQHREVQAEMSDGFMKLFPRMEIRSGGVRSGFRHVEEEEEKEVKVTLLRVFRCGGANSTIVVSEVDPKVESLDDDDVFVLDVGDKIWVWQGRKCSPVEKAKAAQVVHDMTLAKRIDSEVVSQLESRSRTVVRLLSGDNPDAEIDFNATYSCPRPLTTSSAATEERPRKLFKLSDESGELRFDMVKEEEPIQRDDLQHEDVFVVDSGRDIWVWEGLGASRAEKKMWLRVAQAYIKSLGGGAACLAPLAKVVEGNESPAFFGALGG